MIDSKLTPAFSHNQFFVLITGACLGWALGAPAFLSTFPGSRAVLGFYALLGVLLFVLTAASWFSDRPRRILSNASSPIWSRNVARYLLAALWTAAALLFFRNYKLAFEQASTLSHLGYFGFGLWAAAGLVLCLGPALLESRSLSSRRGAVVLSLLVVAGFIFFGFYLWGANLGAQWWIIDDHDTISLIGADYHLAMADAPAHLQAMGRWEELVPFASLRLRPVYWIFQSVESAVWGDQPLLWYFLRISVFVLACAVCFQLCKSVLGTLNSLLFTLVLATLPFWGDIFPRLGPAENYALLGVIGYALAFVALVRHYRSDAPDANRRVPAYWVLLGLATLVCVGAKENFVTVLLPNVILFCYLLVRRQLSWLAIVILGVTTVVGVLSLVSVLAANTANGSDVYGNSSTTPDRLVQTVSGLRLNLLGVPVLGLCLGLGLIVGVGALALYRAGDRQGLRRLGRTTLFLALLAAGLVALYVSQLYFYDGNLPTNTRYDLPATLILAFLGLVGIVLVLQVIHLVLKQPFYDVLAATFLSFMLAGFILVNGYDAARQASRQNFERTRQFTQQLADIQAAAQKNPDAAIVMDTHSGWDLEPSSSVVRFLRRDGVVNPIFLRYTGDDYLGATHPQQKLLAVRLHDISQGTYPSEFYESFRKFSGAQCFSVGFSGESTPPCELLTRIWR